MTTFTGTAGNDSRTGTTGADVFVYSQGGNDSLNGAAGNDVFNLGTAFTAGDQIDGGSNADTLNLGGSISVVFGAKTLTNVETVNLANAGAYNLTLAANTATLAQAGTFEIDGHLLTGSNTMTVDGSLSSSGIDFLAGSSTAYLTGGNGNDSFSFANSFTAADQIDGGSGSNTLNLSGTTSVVFNATTLTNVGTINLADTGSYNLTFGAQSIIGHSLTNGYLLLDASALTGAHAETIDASQASDPIVFLTGAGRVHLMGGAGEDAFDIAANTTLAGDVFDAGGGLFNSLNFLGDFTQGNNATNTLSWLDPTFKNINGIGFYGAGTYHVTVGDIPYEIFGLSIASYGAQSHLYVDGSADVADGLDITGAALSDTLIGGAMQDEIIGGGGNDSLYGGGGNDVIGITPSQSDHFHVDGGAGDDQLGLTLTAQKPVTLDATSLTSVERLVLQVNGGDLNHQSLTNRESLILNDGNVAAGGVLSISLASINVTPAIDVDGSAETDGRFVFDVEYLDNGLGSGVTAAYGARWSGGAGNDIFLGANPSANGGTANLWDGGGGINTLDYSIDTQALTIDAATGTAKGTGSVGDHFVHMSIFKLGSGTDSFIGSGASETVYFGASGAQAATGAGGNDTYVVDNGGDKVFEATNGGSDTVLTSVSYAVLASQSVELLATNAVSGTAGLHLIGNALAQGINGNNGANFLNDGGAGGADTMSGFGGNDTYVVANAGDQVIEAANGGTDTVFAAVSYALTSGQSVELLGTVSVATHAPLNLTGNDFAQAINGNNGANILIGRGGDDTIFGQDGNDVISGGAGHDVIAPGSGNDTVVWGAISESTGIARDLIAGIDLTSDKFQFTVKPIAIDAEVTHGSLNSIHFDQNLAAAIGAGQLAAHHAILFDPDSGDQNVAGHVFLIVDANGVAGYQVGQDYVVELSGATGILTLGDFT